jgi:hypothetical protein
MTVNEIRAAILSSNLSMEDIYVINQALVMIKNQRAQDNINALKVNERVKWVNKNKSTEFGIIKKISRTTVNVLSENDNMMWKIPASMLLVA